MTNSVLESSDLSPSCHDRDPQVIASSQFSEWLWSEKLSLAVTTYQSNRLFLIGAGDSSELSVSSVSLNRPMGLFATPSRLTVATLYQIWQLDNILPEGQTREGFDRCFMPRVGFTTGQLNAHDIVIDREGEVLFVNTRFNCVAAVSARGSFRVCWKPNFITALAPEDRCHLNGLALVDGRPRYVTCVSQSDQPGGWRRDRWDGGCVIDMATDEVVCKHLSMPHSPRLRHDRLWLLNSGHGDLGYVDMQSGRFEAVACLPGYGRGLALVKEYAIVGLSKPRRNHALAGLPFQARGSGKDDLKCGLWVIDLDRGTTAHWLQFEGLIGELYDVQILKGVRRPRAISLDGLDIRRHVLVECDPGMAPHPMEIC